MNNTIIKQNGNSKRRMRVWVCLLGFLLGSLSVSALQPWPEEGINWPAGQIMPSFAASEKIQDFIYMSGRPAEEHHLFSSFKGLINAKKPRIFSYDGDGSAEGEFAWLTSLGYNYRLADPWDLLLKYKDEVNKCIIYSTATNCQWSVNIATSYAKQYQAVVASPDMAAKLMAPPYNFTCAWDLRTLAASSYNSEQAAASYLYTNFWPTAEKRILAGLNPANHAGGAREYAAALGLAVVWLDPHTSAQNTVLNNFLTAMPLNGVYIGWGVEERRMVARNANNGITTIPSDYAVNLPFHGGTSRVIEPKPMPPCPPLENKVYVAFIISDGDNLQSCEHMIRILWSEGARGKVPIGWTVSPAMVDAMPGALNYYHQSATDNDCLISGPSGLGYTFPSRWNGSGSKTFANYVAKTEEYNVAAGLRVITVWSVTAASMTSTTYTDAAITSGLADTYANNAPTLLGITDQGSSEGHNQVSLRGTNPNLMPNMYLACNYCNVNSPANQQNLVQRIVARSHSGGSTSGSTTYNLSGVNVSVANSTKWTRTEPRFLILQGDIWNGAGPDNFKQAMDRVLNGAPWGSTTKDEIVFVRPDHLMLLFREHTNKTNANVQKNPGVIAAVGGNGLKGEFFNGDFAVSKGCNTATTVNFNWGASAPFVSDNNFTVRWTGQVQPKSKGQYTFFVTCNGGARLWVNGELIIDNWFVGTAAPATYQGSFSSPGSGVKCDIKLEYLKRGDALTCGDDARCTLEWGSAFFSREVVPQNHLFSTACP